MLALIVFFALRAELSVNEILPIISVLSIYSGAVACVSISRTYFPASYDNIPFIWLKNTFMFSKIDFEVSMIKFVWCRVTKHCL